MAAGTYASLLRKAKGLIVGRTVNLTRPLAELSDDELVERCQERDHEAFTEIVERYKDRVHWLVRRMVGGANDEDITQEVFLRVYQAIDRFQGRSSFRTWLYRIARNLCVTELKKRDAHGRHLSIDEEGEEKVHWLLPDSPGGLEAEIERRDLSEKVQALIGRLPEGYRTVLTLFYLQQVRYEEIADIMDIPLGTVKTHIHRARLRLRDLILAEPDIAGLTGASDNWTTSGGGNVS
jgi:RNA polymerase sigma-70 factor (ECF subfamily)